MLVEKLARRDWGGGPRRALLLHGSTSSSATWWQIGPALAARGWSVCALDLPGHGASPALGGAVLPVPAAAAVTATVGPQGFDLLVGHSFGAAVAVALLAGHPAVAARVVLEELPGPRSVDWTAEARAVRDGVQQARLDIEAEIARTRARQARWAPQDCRHAAQDLAACRADDVAGGLALGSTWLPRDPLSDTPPPLLLLLAPDVSGVNRLEDASALRGRDREQARSALHADVQILDAGHCIHRDDPDGWVRAVTGFAAHG